MNSFGGQELLVKVSASIRELSIAASRLEAVRREVFKLRKLIMTGRAALLEFYDIDPFSRDLIQKIAEDNPALRNQIRFMSEMESRPEFQRHAALTRPPARNPYVPVREAMRNFPIWRHVFRILTQLGKEGEASLKSIVKSLEERGIVVTPHSIPVALMRKPDLFEKVKRGSRAYWRLRSANNRKSNLKENEE